MPKKTDRPTLGSKQAKVLSMDPEYPLRKMIPYEHNPRKHGHTIDHLKRSIQKWGAISPIVVTGECKKIGLEDGTIAAGHARHQAALKSGEKTFPAIIVKFKTKAAFMAYVIADNQIATHSTWLSSEFEQLYNQIDKAGWLPEDMGFADLSEVQEIRASDIDNQWGAPKDPDAVPEPPKKAKAKLGDLYILGDHRVLCGDATKAEDVDRLMDGVKAEMVFTDPPYGINIVKGKVGRVGFGRVAQPHGPRKAGPVKGQVIPPRVYRKVIGDNKPFDPEFLLGLAPVIMIFGANHFASKLPDKPGWLVWDKGVSVKADFSSCELIWCNIGGHIRRYEFLWSGLIRAGSRDVELAERVHPTQKPVGLIVKIFEDYEGRIVLDPYLGSGSTLIACETLGRKCYGMEIEPIYIDVIVKRWEKFTGKDAILKSTGKTFTQVKASRGRAKQKAKRLKASR